MEKTTEKFISLFRIQIFFSVNPKFHSIGIQKKIKSKFHHLMQMKLILNYGDDKFKCLTVFGTLAFNYCTIYTLVTGDLSNCIKNELIKIFICEFGLRYTQICIIILNIYKVSCLCLRYRRFRLQCESTDAQRDRLGYTI